MNAAVVDLTRLKKLHCGLGQFALHLGRTLQAEAVDLRLLFLTHRGTESLLAGIREPLHTCPARWWQKEFFRPLRRYFGPLRAPQPPADVWHTIDQLSAFAPQDDRTPVILTIHDLNFPRHWKPAQVERSLRRLQRRVDRATLLTTGSHFAAEQIRSLLDVSGKELRVIHHGLCVRPQRTAPRPRFAPSGRFLFSIGEFRPYKNFHVLIELLRELPSTWTLVIAGNVATPYGEQVRRLVRRWGLQERVLLPGIVSDEERHWLYEHCEAFLFPSLAEGFGLPAIEGMSFGKPVFLAEATSLPEVGGPLAFYWRDFAPGPMREVFEQGMAQAAADPTYAERVRRHAQQFTWPEAARRYLELYRQVAAGGGTSKSPATADPRAWRAAG